MKVNFFICWKWKKNCCHLALCGSRNWRRFEHAACLSSGKNIGRKMQTHAALCCLTIENNLINSCGCEAGYLLEKIIKRATKSER